MCGETAYSKQNITVKRMFDYWEQGVSRGDFSYRESVLSYLSRAGLSASGIEARETKAGLLLTQSLGKATLNLITLSAIAAATPRDKFVLVHGLAIEEAGGYLEERGYLKKKVEKTKGNPQKTSEEPGSCPQETMLNQTVFQARTIELGQAFNRLQEAQDERNATYFMGTIKNEIVATGVLFVRAATTYGLPQPGFSSGEVEPWLGPVQRHTVPVL